MSSSKVIKQTITSSNSNKKYESNILKSPATIKVDESALLSFKITKLNTKIKTLNKNISSIKQCKNALEKDFEDSKLLLLTEKWNSICKQSLNHLHNTFMLKYKSNDGYLQELENEVKFEKEKIKYQCDCSLEGEWEDIQTSKDFQLLDEWQQRELENNFKERLEKNQQFMDKELNKLDKKIEDFKQNGGEFDLKELCKKLQVDYNLIYT